MSLRLACYLLGVVIAAITALAIGMIAGGSAFSNVIAGIPDAGAITRWGLPTAKLIADLAAVATAGALLAATALLPSDKGMLSRDALPYARAASWTAAIWAIATALTLLLTLSDVLAVPPGQLLGDGVLSFIASIPQGNALFIVLLLATSVALFARDVITVGTAAGLLIGSLVALLPPILTGHSASSPNHSMAITGLGLHVVTLALWVGGLVVVIVHALRRGPHLAVVAQRFSAMALWCYAAVAVSGVASTAARLTEPVQLVSSAYGQLILAKTAALIVLGLFGWLHRRRTLTDLSQGKPRSFLRLALAEVLIMAAVIGLAVALSRTSPPLIALIADPVRDLLGYALPPELTVTRLVSMWRLDLFFALLSAVAAGLYLTGVVRLRRRGDSWPTRRLVAWLLGVLIIVVFTQSGIAVYAPVLFSMHMMQHMGLAMLAPIFLVLGAPVTLALRAFRPATRRGDRGPREWIVAVLHSRAAAVISHPVVAMVIFISSSYALYFTSLFESAMRQPVGHILMNAHFLLSGVLFFWVIIGVDPGPRRLPYIGKLMALMMTMPFHAFFGIAMMSMGTAIASSWYDGLGRTWGVSTLADQRTAGGMAWAFGEIPTMIVVITIAVQWGLSDHRKARREDRRANRRGEAELSSYNDYLAQLDKRSREQ
ncbi:cytochrome c oxidase assembly protein [Streptosporangium subroseum]|uniref:cytochrome c oxidase assembly protein n=1 Tax=Streptosporangium subroseum TaxID=106412 RepID=UPI00308BFD8D|nr:bifunctional copper resistance protein CopD/cytochrome c oxidase assembly protein [Streptosporangium subroseum]